MEDIYETWDIQEKIANINIFINSIKLSSTPYTNDNDLRIIDNMNAILEYYNNKLKNDY